MLLFFINHIYILEVQKGNQNQQQSFQDVPLGTERLTSLHEKLHHEADKIRKWKVQTEMDLKQKV